MDKEQVTSWLKDICSNKDWFHSVGFDQYGRVVVYVHYMNAEVLRFVPDWAEDGSQVLCHFASSVTSKADNFLNKPMEKKFPTFAGHGETVILSNEEANRIGLYSTDIKQDAYKGKNGVSLTPEEEDRQLELSVQVLTNELDSLERLCGSNILQDIFYEIQDGKNAVTNLSAKYPEVRQRMQKLYDKYGFDIIYEELDG